MRRAIIMILTGIAGLALTAAAVADSSNVRGSSGIPAHETAGAHNSTHRPGVDKRQANQEKRIQQGIKSGQLTPEEAARLEKQQARIQKAEVAARADGKITPQEQRKLDRMQDNASDDIARKKHNKRKAANAY